MSSRWILLLPLFFWTAHAHGQELLENPTFEKNAVGWKATGKMVLLDASGKETEDPAKGKPAFKVELSANRLKTVECDFRTTEEVKNLTATVEFIASADFKPDRESHDFSKVDFKPGGTYYWSAELAPPADLSIRITDVRTFVYGLVNVATPGAPETFKTSWSALHPDKRRKLCLNLTPGTGSIYLTKVSVTAQ